MVCEFCLEREAEGKIEMDGEDCDACEECCRENEKWHADSEPEGETE